MDSEDEFEFNLNHGGSGVVITGGLDIKEILQNRHASFEIDACKAQLWDDMRSELDLDSEETTEAGKMSDEAKAEEELYKDFKAMDFGDDKQKLENEVDLTQISFEELEQTMENVTEDGGIKKLVKVPGTGPVLTSGQIVYVEYKVMVETGDETCREVKVIYYSKNRDGKPGWERFKLDCGGVIPALDVGVLTMRLYERSLFLATYKYAYGALGIPHKDDDKHVIPPMATVLVEVHVTRVVEVGKTDGSVNLLDLPPHEREKVPVPDILAAAKEFKQYGNDHYKDDCWSDARRHYRNAIRLLTSVATPFMNEEKEISEMHATIMVNMARCFVKEAKYAKAREYLEGAMKRPYITNGIKTKVYYWLAFSCLEMNEVAEAKANIDKAKQINGADQEIETLFVKIEKKILADKEEEKKVAKKMFRGQ